MPTPITLSRSMYLEVLMSDGFYWANEVPLACAESRAAMFAHLVRTEC